MNQILIWLTIWDEMTKGDRIIAIFLFYFLLCFITKWYREIRLGEKREELPNEYIRDFADCKPCSDTLIDKGEEVPQDSPTLLMIGKFFTKCNLIRSFDYFSNLLTFGCLRFNEIFPVGQPMNLLLYFQNISKNNFRIEEAPTKFFIKYPNEIKPSRHWDIKIPSLEDPTDNCRLFTENFFVPEVSGEHEMLINGIEGVRFAGPYGVAGRKYRIPEAGGAWRLTFHVSNSHEYKVFLISFIALTVSMISLLIAIIGKS